jgi:hypothetical protein
MVDGVQITAGSGTTIGTDDVSDVHYQVIKIASGADGAVDGLVSAGYPLPVDSGASTVAIYNVTCESADTEYSQELPAICRRVCVQARTAVVLRLAFVTGKVATPTEPYLTLRAGDIYDSGPVHLASATLYVASPTAGAVAELEAWS